jgi:hypothetical protein
VNGTYQWTRLFIAARGHYGIAKIFSYFFLVLIYFLDICSIQEYLDLEYPSFSMKHDKYAWLSLGLPFNVYLSPLLVYDIIFKTFMLCHRGLLP